MKKALMEILACPECKGFGSIIEIDFDKVIPDRRRSLADGAVEPWNMFHSFLTVIAAGACFPAEALLETKFFPMAGCLA